MPDPGRPRDADAVISALAARQHGVVSRAQLLEARVPKHVIRHRLKRRRLLRVHRGVYRVGSIEAPYAREMAALLACGDEAVLCDRTAAVLWKLLRTPRKARGVVDVCVPPQRQVHRRGIRVRRRKTLPADEVAARHGLRLTTAARTLLDLAGSVSEGTLERAVARADRKNLADRNDLQKLLDRYPRARAAAKLRGIVDLDGGPALTRSEAERRLLHLIRKAKLPTPETNVRIAGIEVDFFWPAERLVAEMDGFAYHNSRSAFEWDRERDSVLATAGMRFLRLTWRQVTEEPEAVVAMVTRSLGARGQTPARRPGT